MNKTERNNHVSNINRLMRQELKSIPGTLVLKETAAGKVQIAIEAVYKRYIFETDIEAYFTGSISVDLQQFLKLFKQAEITSVDVADKVEIRTKTGTHYLVREFLDEQYKQSIMDVSGFDYSTFLRADEIQSLRPYLSTDDLRPAMTGIYVGNRRGSGYLCGTNAHILKHIRQNQLPDSFQEMIIPADAVSCLPKNGKVDLYTSAEHQHRYMFNCETYRFVFDGIDERYPDFLAVIPDEKIPVAEMDKNKVLEALKIAQNVNTTTKQFRLFSRGVSLYLRAEDLDTGQEYESMAIGTALMDEYEQGFNAKLFETVLKDSGSDIVRLQYTGHKNRLAKIGADGSRIIMPVMLNSYA